MVVEGKKRAKKVERLLRMTKASEPVLARQIHCVLNQKTIAMATYFIESNPDMAFFVHILLSCVTLYKQMARVSAKLHLL